MWSLDQGHSQWQNEIKIHVPSVLSVPLPHLLTRAARPRNASDEVNFQVSVAQDLGKDSGSVTISYHALQFFVARTGCHHMYVTHTLSHMYTELFYALIQAAMEDNIVFFFF